MSGEGLGSDVLKCLPAYPDDLKILRSTNSSVGLLPAEFFEVNWRNSKSRFELNVQVLLKIGHQTTAVEIMDQMWLFQVWLQIIIAKVIQQLLTNC